MQTSWLSNLTLALLIAFASVIAGCGDPQVDTVKEDAREQFKKEVRADGISIHIVFKGDFPGSEEAGRVSGQLSDELWKKRLGTCNSLKSGGQTGDWEIGLSVNDLDLAREVLQAQLKELGLSKDATIYKWRYEPLSMARKFSSISSKNISPQVKRDMRVIWGQYSHFIDVRKRRPNNQADLRSLENPSLNIDCWVDYLSADETGQYGILYSDDGFQAIQTGAKATIVAYKKKPLKEGVYVAYTTGELRIISKSEFDKSLAELKANEGER